MLTRTRASQPAVVGAIVAALVTIVAVQAAFAALPNVKRMPPYRGDAGESIDDPARIKSEGAAFESAYKAYKEAAREYREEVREYIQDEIVKRQRRIADTYQNQIDKIDGEQTRLRKEAIDRLEGFVFRHREHDNYTPDALFRLAELYYEDSLDEYNKSIDNFDKNLDLYNRGKLLDPPVEKEKDFSRSIAIYKYLHWVPPGTRMEPLSGRLAGVTLPRRWPNYRNADAALYLQGFCEAEMLKTDQAIATLASLEKHYPKSSYIAEAWLRVGELYFDNNEFEQAADAYKRAAATHDPKMYGLALYKLGWAYFQMYRYPEAVRWFQTLIEYYDEELPRRQAEAKAAGKEMPEGEGEGQGANLRKEAVEYLAKSLAEPSWDDDGCDDFGGEEAKGECVQVHPKLRARLYTSCVLEPDTTDFPDWMAEYGGEPLATLQRNVAARNDVRKSLMNGKPYVREVLMEYGNAVLEQAEDDYYRQGVIVLSYIVDTWPMEREAQALQKKVIRAVDLLAAAAPSYTAELEKNPNSREAMLGLALASEAQDRQITERRKYLALFSPGTPWFEKWGSDRELATQVNEMVNQVRMNFARLIHARAQTLRAAGKEQEALAKYAEAAKEYETLYKADPASETAYALAWTIADVYFFSGKFCDANRDKDGGLIMVGTELLPYAAEDIATIKAACGQMSKSVAYYDIVRDWKGAKGKDDEGKPLDYTEEAAFSSIIATERILVTRAAYPQGDPERLPARMVPEIRPSAEDDERDIEANKEASEAVRVKPLDVDRAIANWIKAVDGYIDSGLTNKDDPKRSEKLALKAAELLYKNRHFDPWAEQPYKDLTPEFWSSRLRFRAILKNFPKTTAASESAKNLLTSFQIEKDVDAMKLVREELKDVLDQKTVEALDKQLRIIFLGEIAKKAENLNRDADQAYEVAKAEPDPAKAFALHQNARALYAKAADEYKRLRVETDVVDTKKQALLNALALYYRAEKWDSCFESLDLAEQMLRDALKDPSKPKKEQAQNAKSLLDVIERRAKLQYQFFRIPEAIANFQEVYKMDPDGKKGQESLLNAALLAFRNGNFDLAMELNEEITRKFARDPKRKQAVDDANWRITECFEKKGDVNGHVQSLFTFVDRYKKDRDASDKVFKAWAMIANIYRSRGDTRREFQTWKLIVSEFEKGGYEKNGRAEATATAEAQFRIMEPRYEAFLKMKLTPNPKLSAGKQIQQLQKQLRAMLDIVVGPEQKKKNPDTGQEYTVRDGGLYKEYLDNVALYGSQNWSYAAMLYRAKALQHLARTIYGVPPPEELSEEEEEAYAEAIESVGAQIENKAIASLEAALKDAESKGVVNEWVTKLRAAINKYKPAEYPLLKEARRLQADPQGVAPGPEKELR
jgi:tetratricopeptide (TPR) repeat protein